MALSNAACRVCEMPYRHTHMLHVCAFGLLHAHMLLCAKPGPIQALRLVIGAITQGKHFRQQHCWQLSRTSESSSSSRSKCISTSSMQKSPASTAAGMTGIPTIHRQLLSPVCMSALSANKEPSMPPHSSSSYSSTSRPLNYRQHPIHPELQVKLEAF